MGATLLFTLIFIIAHDVIQSILKINFFFVVTIPLACFLAILHDVFLALFRNKEKHGLFTLFSIVKNVLEVGLTILFVISLKYHWQGRLGSSLISLIAAFLFICLMVRKWKYFTGHINVPAIKRSAQAGLPFIPERLAIFVLLGSDRFFIDHFDSLSEVGLYGTGAQLAIILNLSISILGSTFNPIIYKNLQADNSDFRGVKKATLTYVGISALITLGIIIATPYFFKFFIGPLFQKGQVYAVYLTIGMFFWAVYNAFLPYLLIAKKNRLIMNISIFGMIISILMNYFNVKRFGAIGATYTSISVYFLMAAITIYFVHKTYNLKKILQ
jgi:O-antigen/teichoic acid export membrane protein